MTVVPNIALLMCVAHRSFESDVMGALVAAGSDDITLAQVRLVARLEPGGMRVTTLARSAGITKQTAGALVDQLERRGYFVRGVDPTDGRASLVRLSDRGLVLWAAVASAGANVEQAWREHLGNAMFEHMRDGLFALAEIAGPAA